LKPARIAKKQARIGKGKTAKVVKSTSNKPAAATKQAKAPITPPPPIRAPFIPKLDTRIETRFASKSVYPHTASVRNLFKLTEKKVERVIVNVIAEENETPVFTERPDISYHGFFKVGKNKVAILKLANELTYSKLGSILKRTTFKLLSVTSDRVIVEDTSDEQRTFEISLADTSNEKE